MKIAGARATRRRVTAEVMSSLLPGGCCPALQLLNAPHRGQFGFPTAANILGTYTKGAGRTKHVLQCRKEDCGPGLVSLARLVAFLDL